MDEEGYRLRCSVYGHSLDVRAVKPLLVPGGGFVSGSRDRTVRIWTPSEFGPGYTETHCLRGPSHFVSSLCTLPPSKQYPSGLILAGSNDCAIYGFSLDSSQPILKLLGHSSTVCSLTAGNFGTVVSGSWDKTARIWLGQKCVMVLEGHQEAVWAVELFKDQGLTLTASADKTIRLWRSGNCEKIFRGHEECVRGLAILSDTEFLSCSNDLTVRMWQTSGNCVGVFCGHTDYIYSIAVLNDDGDFVTSSEDQTVKIWKQGICVQSIKLPSKSLWAVACLPNEDIAVGGSDASIRIFTKQKEFAASPAEIMQFENEIRHAEVKASQPGKKNMLGDLNLNDLRSADALLTPGTHDGQTLICREGDSACLYEWSEDSKAWKKVGDVIDANDTKRKVMYEGQEYDYVFTIDVEDGKYLKLPYNLDENPWMAAQKFIDKHNLSQVFLDEIANFIANNTKGDVSSVKVATPSSAHADPYTGLNRYIPGGVFIPGPGGDMASPAEPPVFPMMTYLRFDSANLEGLRNKLIEFSNQVAPNLKLTEDEVKSLMLLTDFPEKVTDQQMASLDKVMGWPNEYVFPALDLFRLAVRSEVMNEKVGEVGGIIVANYLMKYLLPHNPPANNMLVLRTFCNFFGHATGEHLLVDHMEKICVGALNCVPSNNKKVEVAAASLFLNYSVALQKSGFPYNSVITDSAITLAKRLTDPEAIFRVLVCIGTLIEHPSASAAIKSSDVKFFVKEVSGSGMPNKVLRCANLLMGKFDF